MSGDRFNEGKLKWSLVSWKALEPMVEVLMFGRNKYFSIFASELEKTLKPWNVKIAKETGLLDLKNCVAVAMNNNCLITIKSIRKIDPNIKKNIKEKMLKDFENFIEKESSKEKTILNIKEKKETDTILKDMVLLQKSLTKEEKSIVKFVEEKKPLCTQIITIQLENLEVCFAVSAITGLDSSTMTLNFLEKLLNISINKENHLKSGSWNWTKGLKYTEICESLQRHLNAFIQGEDDDQESKLSHVGHILCNAMFLSYMYLFKKDFDDRYKDENINKEN